MKDINSADMDVRWLACEREREQALMWGRESFCKRNGHGIQEWPDGCKYEGEFVNKLKHGPGVFTWPSGEFFKGSFFKDYRHGKGLYSWPNGAKYTGKFYLNRKEGYGIQVNCHDDVIHILLDSGADVNKLNDEGMSALAVCHVLYYPLQSLQETLAERTDENLERSISSDDPTFDSACSMASFHIDVTEEIIQKSAEILCQTGTVTPTDTQETVRKIALLKTEHRNRWTTIKLLLERGADPNASTVPMPVIFLAIKAAHVKGVRRLLECGARTDIPLLPEQKGLYPLHIAAGLSGAEGPKITELLLHALADPDVKALDAHEVYELDKDTFEPQAFKIQHLIAPGSVAKFSEAPVELPQEGGRTPLHVACQRDSEYSNARDVVALLLSHNANPNNVWSGHSPLSLAISRGNDLAVDELLAGGADPNLRLTRHVGSALCALVNISYDRGPHPRNQVKLLEKLIKAGADILMPVVVGEGRRCAVGTVVDYTHCAFQQNQRMAHTPYHALNKHERQAYNTRRQLLGLMGDLLRQAVIRMEKERSQDCGFFCAVCVDCVSFRKQRFKYCYECGRSVGVQLSACSRCREVFYCSKTCKTKAWDERHRDECVRVPGWY
uniref:Ankyrin repeat and MYND domain containing 1 n=1 Tax=Cyprinus carpio TaxID=7962 RepID=A0A8C1K9T5_CYPCA